MILMRLQMFNALNNIREWMELEAGLDWHLVTKQFAMVQIYI